MLVSPKSKARMSPSGSYERIAFDTDDPVQLSDLSEGTDAAPRDVPLHPGAERYYREHGCKRRALARAHEGILRHLREHLGDRIGLNLNRDARHSPEKRP